MQVYVRFWEIALLIIAAAVVVAVVYLVKNLKTLNITLTRINKLIDENESQFKNILKNSDKTFNEAVELTEKAKKGIEEVENIISGVSQSKNLGIGAANTLMNYSKLGFAAISIISGIINYRRRKKRKYRY